MIFRNRYNNHCASNPYISSMHEKSTTNIQKSYPIALPRWTLRFINGNFYFGPRLRHMHTQGQGQRETGQRSHCSYLGTQWIQGPKLTHRQTIYCCNATGPLTMCAQRLWHRVYNPRFNHPEEDIIIYKDDLVSAFRRICYHLDVTAAYTFVIGVYLVLLVGMVFGSRDSPSLFCLISDLRSFAYWFFYRLHLSCPTTSMINRVSFPHDTQSSRDINPKHKDPMNQGVNINKLVPQLPFFDDMTMAEVISLILLTADNITLTESVFIGNSDLA